MPTERLLRIDGQYFDVMIIKLSRTASILDKKANRTLDGDIYREIIGTYINYNIEFAYNDDPNKYIKLWNILIQPKEWHLIRLPDTVDSTEFKGYIASVKDNIIYANPNNIYERKFVGLSCDIIAKTPNLRP